MNTPSTKADSFFGHRDHCPDCVRRARSKRGKCATRNVAGGIYVSVENQSAVRATVGAHVQILLNRAPTLTAILTGSPWINFYDFNTGASSLVFKDADELVPTSIGNRSGKPVVPHHPLDVEALHSDLAIATDQNVCGLVRVVASLIRNACVNALQLSHGLPPVFTPDLLAAHGTTGDPQCGNARLQESGVWNLKTIRSSKKVCESNVNSRCGIAVGQRRNRRLFGCNSEVPLSGFEFQCQCFNGAHDFTVQTNPDNPHVLHPEPIASQSDAVAMVRKRDGVELIASLEARITRCAALFHSAKEVLKRLVKSSHRGFGTLTVEALQPWVGFACHGEYQGLLEESNRFLMDFVSRLALLQTRIVEAAMRLKHDVKLAPVIRVGPQPEFVALVLHHLANCY